MTLLRFPDEQRMCDPPCRYPDGIEASVTILPIVPRFHPDFQRQNIRRLDGIALLIKTKHPALALPRSVERPCDSGEPDDVPLTDGVPV